MAFLNNEQNQFLAGFNPKSPPKSEEKLNEFSSDDIKNLMEKFSHYFSNVDDYDEDDQNEDKLEDYEMKQEEPFSLKDQDFEFPVEGSPKTKVSHNSEFGHSNFWKVDPMEENEKERLILTLMEEVDLNSM